MFELTETMEGEENFKTKKQKQTRMLQKGTSRKQKNKILRVINTKAENQRMILRKSRKQSKKTEMKEEG